MPTATGEPDDPLEQIRRLLEQSAAVARLSEEAQKAAAAFQGSSLLHLQEAAREAMAPMQEALRAAQSAAALEMPSFEVPQLAQGQTTLSKYLRDISARHRLLFDGLPSSLRAAANAAAADLGVDEDFDSFDRNLSDLVERADQGSLEARTSLIDFLTRYRRLLFWIFQLLVMGLVVTTNMAADDPEFVRLIDQVGLVTEMLVVASQVPRDGRDS